jgi:Domain of unknown function (DUF4340)
MIGRGIWLHVTLLLVAAMSAIYVWTRDKKAASAATADVTVWSGRAEVIESIAFQSKTKSVSLAARKDGQGVWFFGTVTTNPPTADGGAPVAPKPVTFASVGAADKVAHALAPFRATREIGRVGNDRAAEFGLRDPDGTLDVSVGGQKHRLTLGGPAPGGKDRYVKDDASGIVYAAKGDFVRDIEAAESALVERELHEFKDPDVQSARIVAHGKSREVLRRGPDGKRIWSAPAAPDQADETLANWMAKIERLRPNEYLPEPKSPPESVVRVEYKAKGVQGAFVELAKLPSEGSAKPDYVVRSERTRLWAKVPPSAGEQVEQDLDSVVK